MEFTTLYSENLETDYMVRESDPKKANKKEFEKKIHERLHNDFILKEVFNEINKENIQKYYKKIDHKEFIDVFYGPSGVRIERVPSAHLGFGVLGQAMPSINLIQIKDDLYGSDFEEVKKHEINHILYPHMTEFQIREKTKREFPTYTRFH